jgi:hypothetical protein
MKIFGWASKTMIGVVFFIVLVWSMRSCEAEAEAQAYIGLGHTFANSSVTSPEIGYRFGSYGIEIGATGEGNTDKGHQYAYHILSAYRVIDPKWCVFVACFKSAIGAAYTPNQRLIGPLNYRLEIIVSLPAGAEFYIKHLSSAGTFKNNTGVDVAGMRFVF